MTIKAQEAAVIRFELVAMAARIKEIGALCRNEWLLAPLDIGPPLDDTGAVVKALEARAESLAEIFMLPANSALSDITYPPSHKQPDGSSLWPHGERAWAIVDRFIPAKLSTLQRYVTAGLIAGVMHRCVEEALDDTPLQPVADSDN